MFGTQTYKLLPDFFEQENFSESAQPIDRRSYSTSSFISGCQESIPYRQREERVGTKVVQIDVPKHLKGKLRPIAHLPILEEVEYFLIVRHLANMAKGLENNISLSFRPNYTSPSSSIFREENGNPFSRWNSFVGADRNLCDQFFFCCRTDIENFFACIPHKRLLDELRDHFLKSQSNNVEKTNQLLDRLELLLKGWFPSGIGLPQGSIASFFLADMYLLSIGTSFAHFSYRVIQYVDDYRIFANRESIIWRQYEFLEAYLADLGLSINKNKTEIDESRFFADRIDGTKRVCREYDNAISRISVRQHRSRIEIALEHLKKALWEGDIDKYAVNYLLSQLAKEIGKSKRLKDDLIIQIEEIFKEHTHLSGMAVQKWRPVFSSLIEFPAIQELLVALIVKNNNLTVTDHALCCGLASLATTLASNDARRLLNTHLEAILSRSPQNMNATELALIGKALRAYQKHGKGNDFLLDNWKEYNGIPALRPYMPVAGVDLTGQRKQNFYRELSRRPDDHVEAYHINYFYKYGEVYSPDRRGFRVMPYGI